MPKSFPKHACIKIFDKEQRQVLEIEYSSKCTHEMKLRLKDTSHQVPLLCQIGCPIAKTINTMHILTIDPLLTLKEIKQPKHITLWKLPSIARNIGIRWEFSCVMVFEKKMVIKVFKKKQFLKRVEEVAPQLPRFLKTKF